MLGFNWAFSKYHNKALDFDYSMNELEQVVSFLSRRDLSGLYGLLKAHPYLLMHKQASRWPLLHQCIYQECVNLEMLKLYVNYGGDVNRRTDSGVSLCFLAAKMNDDLKTYDYLVANGALMSTFENVVLLLESAKDEPEVLLKLNEFIELDSELPRYSGHECYTLLHHAVINFRWSVGALLIKAGANVFAATSDGRTPLGLIGDVANPGAQRCHDLLVACGATCSPMEHFLKLLRKGDEAETKNFIGDNPSMTRRWMPYPFSSPLHAVAWLGMSINLLAFFLKRGCDPNAPNERGETPLHRIALRPRKGDDLLTLEMARTLVEAGARVNQLAAGGRSVLHEAASHSFHDLTKLLVELGGDPNLLTVEGQTVLDIVVKMKFQGCHELASWLKINGAVSGRKRN